MCDTQAFTKQPISVAVQAAIYSMLLATSVQAAPSGGQVVGGTGSINQSGLNTTINQASQNMAINWQSYDVNANERVQYIQPNASSISLNRILSNNGSTIAGRIDANGQVILVNPNGIFFTPTSVVNVGGIIASGLDIKPDDFMNGNYIFNDVLGKDGAVVNTGTINASLGGNVALIGRQVKNDGLIAANLGTVTLAAGKQAVLTFDNGGVLGVRVSKAILQDELGVDPAVINKGDIQASGGRVLLTASTSQDVFSQAVNTNGIQQATSVVVNADGTFTLGSGADTVNTGTIDTSATSTDQNAGQIVMLGNNVTSSGSLKSDAKTGDGGEIELHSTDTTLLTQNSVTSTRSEINGNGGMVKVLGDKVGLFDQSTVDVSGADGGGLALIGGDQHGGNASIQNASYTIINLGANVFADALNTGNGGNVIVWSDLSTYFAGNIYVRGGQFSGDGGFVETSGKINLSFLGATDRSAINGISGTLLLDPRDITIGNSTADNNQLNDRTVNFADCSGNGCNPATDDFSISIDKVMSELALGDVLMQANRDINVTRTTTAPTNTASHTLTLEAGDDIQISSQLNLGVNNLTMISGSAGCGTSCSGSNPNDVIVNSPIYTSGAVLIESADNVNINDSIISTGLLSAITIKAGNNVSIDETSSNGIVSTNNGLLSITAADSTLSAGTTPITQTPSGTLSGNIIIYGDVETKGGDFSAVTTKGYFRNWLSGYIIDTVNGTSAGKVSIFAAGNDNNANTVGISGALLGQINAGALEVTTTTGQIYQSTASGFNLTATGISAFDAGSNPISLKNTANNLQDVISLTTTGNNTANLVNAATTTKLSDATHATNVGGSLTVNAVNALSIQGAVNVCTDAACTGNSSLRFDSGDTGKSFDLGTTNTAAITATDGTIVINAGSGTGTSAHKFNISGSVSAPNGTVTLNGDGGTDTFHVTTLFTGTVNGNGGTDTLTGPDAAVNNQNDWLITGSGGGTLGQSGTSPSADSITFTGIENLTGGNGVDSFTVNSGGSLSGLIDGGAGANDTLTFNTDGVTVQLGAHVNSNFNVDHMETITAVAGGVADTIIGDDIDNTWTINDLISNSVAPTTGATAENTVRFVNFVNMTGGSGSDTFDFGTALSNTTFAGTVNGGLGNDFFNIHGTNIIFSNTLAGGGGNDTLTGPDTTTLNTDWSMTSAGNGSIATSVTATFTGMSALHGGSGVDTFTFSPGASSGTINGGGGNDVLNAAADTGGNYWLIDTANGGAIYANTTDRSNAANARLTFTGIETLNGNTTDDNFLFATNGSVGVGISGGSTGANVLTARNGANEWDITGINQGALYIDNNASGFGTAYVPSFTAIPTLNGGTGTDRFVMESAGTIQAIDGVGTTGNTLVARAGVDNAWHFTSTTSGNLEQTSPATGIYVNSFTNIQNFVGGGAGNDWADFSGNLSAIIGLNVSSYIGFTGVIGNGANSTLTGINGQANTWEISNLSDVPAAASHPTGTLNGINDGIVNRGQTGQLIFIDFAQLTGGNQNNAFTIQPSGNVTGLISGGGGLSNTLTILNTGIGTVEIGTAGTPANLNVIGFNSITGNGTTAILSDSSTANNWTITGANTGTLNGMTFTNFASLLGGTNNDSFALNNTVDFLGTIDGGAGTGVDVISGGNRVNSWTITGANAGTVTGLSGGFSNVETLRGGNTQDVFTLNDVVDFAGSIDGNGGGNDELRGGNRANAWTITGANSGTVTGLTGAFSNIEILTGNISQDIFTLNDTTNFAGTIDGNGGGTDELRGGNRANTWTITGANSGTVTGLTGGFSNIEVLTGNASQDIFTLNDTAIFAGSINGNGGTTDELRGGNRANTWTITGANNTSTVTGLTGTFSNVQQLTGNAGQDDFVLNDTTVFAGSIDGGGSTTNSLTGGNRVSTWDINTTNGGTVTGLSGAFSHIQNLTGGSLGDTFNYTTGGDLSGLLNGGAGANVLNMLSTTATTVTLLDVAPTVPLNNPAGTLSLYQVGTLNGNSNNDYTLVGPDVSNTWDVTAVNSGTVRLGAASQIVSFNGFRNLTGGAADDTFKLSGTTSELVTGLIDGGGQISQDVLTLDINNVVIQLGTTLTNGQINVTGIESINGNTNNTAGYNTTLIADNITNDWRIDSANGGIINQSSANPVTFTNFDHVQGGAGDDNFLVAFNGSLNFSIDGGNQITSDTADYSGQSVVDVTFGSISFNGIKGLEGVRGNGTNSTLHGPATGNADWTIDGVDAGSVTVGSTTLGFRDFNYLAGGAGNDTFTVTGSGALRNIVSNVAGMITGGAGTNILNIDLAGMGTSNAVLDYVDNAAGTDTIVFNNTSAAAYQANYVPVYTINDPNNATNAGSYSQLNYHYSDGTTTDTSLTLNYRNVGSVTSAQAVDTFTVNGAGTGGAVLLNNGSFMVDAHTPVAYSNVTNLTAQAGTGDNIDINNIALGGTLTLTGGGVIQEVGSVLNADTLSLQNNTAVGAAGNGLTTNVAHLRVTNAGPVYINQQTALDLAALNTTGLLDITAAGNVSSTAALVSNGPLNITSTGDINLTGANQLSGAIAVSEGNADATLNNNSLLLNNTVDTDLANVSVQNLNITSAGNITNSGIIVATGATTLASGGDITLNGANNDFNTVAVTNAMNVALNDINNIGLRLLTANNVNITAGGQISDANAGAMNIVADTVSLTAANGIGGGSVTYDNTNGYAIDTTGAIHTQTGSLSAINLNPNPSSSKGSININNTGNLTVQDMRNNGDILLANSGDIVFAITNVLNSSGTVIGTEGAIDANYHGNLTDPVYAGSVAILGTGSNAVSTLGIGITEADITAENLYVASVRSFGEQARPIRLRINNQFTLLAGIGAVSYPNGPPLRPVVTTADLLTIEGVTSLSGQQMIDIESLGDVDPAIFTEVRNYNHEDVAILLPPDQRLDDDDDNKDKKKRSRSVN